MTKDYVSEVVTKATYLSLAIAVVVFISMLLLAGVRF